MIKFDNVTKKFLLGTVALNNVSFEVEDDEFLFFVGPSGAGKTTIIKLILREILPSSGSIMIDDFDIASKNFSQTTTLRRNIVLSLKTLKFLAIKTFLKILLWD